MIPSITAVRMTGSAHRAQLPLLVLGPSLGTSASALWTACAAGLTDAFDVLAWDLPGHGHNRAVPDEPITMADLAAGVLAVVDDVLAQRDQVGAPFSYAGVSVGGAVGLQLLLDAPSRVRDAALICTAPFFGGPASWADRVATVRSSGTAALVEMSTGRWFAPGFPDLHPEVATPLLKALAATDDGGYVRVCEVVAGFDVRDRLGEISAPVLALAGAADPAAPPAGLRLVADGVAGPSSYAVLPDVAHLAPAEAPDAVLAQLRQFFLGEEPTDPDLDASSDAAADLTAAVRAALSAGLSSAEIEALVGRAVAGSEADES